MTTPADINAIVPGLYDAFDWLVKGEITRGRRRWSVDAALHVLRWQGFGGGRVLNNDITALLARVWIQENPAWPEFFELRRSRFDEPEPDPRQPMFPEFCGVPA
jgi:hypothetical protein